MGALNVFRIYDDCTGFFLDRHCCIHTHTSNIMVGKFQLYSRFITYWLPFCWTKRSQLQSISIAPNERERDERERKKIIVTYTIELNCKHPNSVLMYYTKRFSGSEIYRCTFELGLMHFVNDRKKKKMDCSLFQFSFIIIILWATCFSTAPVLPCLVIVVLCYGFTICHFGDRWRRLIAMEREKKTTTSDQIFAKRSNVLKSKSALSNVDERQSYHQPSVPRKSMSWTNLLTMNRIKTTQDVHNDKPIKWFSVSLKWLGEKTHINWHQATNRFLFWLISLCLSLCACVFKCCSAVCLLIFISFAILPHKTCAHSKPDDSNQKNWSDYDSILINGTDRVQFQISVLCHWIIDDMYL